MSYDANGNILKYKRNKDAGVTQDSLNYKYNAGTNQLQYITDNVANNVSTTDIDGQLPNNYIYDKSGNMVADNSQSMSVSWSPYGKILQNNKAGGANLTFGYNAMQQRVLKRVVLAGDTSRTYYIRDAQGNTMGVYTRHNDSVSWREQYIFGSSRLGLYRADTLVNKGLKIIEKLYEGKRNYELTNHLGNVMAVINDRKADTTVGVNKGYNAVVISATDYFPFGMSIDSRSFSLKTYRYTFNDKENDVETGEQDYGMRIYDPRIAKFLSVDPLTTKYPELTPYQFASDRPIDGVDLDGLEWFPKTDKSGFEWEGFPSKPPGYKAPVYRSMPFALYSYKQGSENFTKIYLSKIIDIGNGKYEGSPIEKTIKGKLPSETLNSGEVYKIEGIGELNVLKYKKQLGTEYEGAEIKIGFKSTNKESKYEFMQIVNGSDFTGNLYDGFDFPFYMPRESKTFKGFTAAFDDSPGQYKDKKGDLLFKATLILYERKGKELMPKLILNYGFKINNGKTTIDKLTMKKIPEK